MTPELIAMLGGGASGFIFKLIGQLVANQQGTVDAMIKKQSAADESHQKAATRGGEWVRRVICLLYTSPSPRDRQKSRMPSSA